MAIADAGMLARKDTDTLVAETGGEDGHGLQRAVGAFDLTALGVGAIIGTGIFVVIGQGIGQAGPAVILSFALAGITCVFSALSYAELASSIPVSGSAYTYAYATLGELVAWIIGWDLILEYGLSVAGIAVGWGANFNELLDNTFGVALPDAIAQPPGEGGTINVPAVAIVLIVAAVLIRGVRESARFNAVMVIVKLVVLAMFVAIALTALEGSNAQPFAPDGFGGVVSAASLIFFAYIGFDAVSTGSEEARNPKRDLPLAICGSLVICTVIYILVAIAAVGALPADQLAKSDAPLAAALEDGAGLPWAASLIAFGACVAITSVVLTILYGQTRIMFSMCRDGLFWPRFAALSPRTHTPVLLTATFAGLIAVLAAVIPLKEIVELVNIGTLFAFVLVNAGVVILRRTRPDMPRSFRVPFVPVFPLIGIALCIYLMTTLPGLTWVRFLVWLALGMVVYAAYGRRHSRLRTGAGVQRFTRE